jgi:signal transduction histidine kinase
VLKASKTHLFFAIFLLALNGFGQSKTVDSLLMVIVVGSGQDLKGALIEYSRAMQGLPSGEWAGKSANAYNLLGKTVDSEGIIFALQQMGEFYEANKMPLESIRFLKLAYQKAERLDSKLQMGITLRRIALVYQNEDMLKESLTYIYQSLGIFLSKEVYTKAIITFYEASLINYKAANYADAVNDFHSALKLLRKLPADSVTKDLKFFIMSGWNTTGRSCMELKRYDEGLQAFDSAAVIADDIHNRFWKGLIAGNKGDLLMKTGKLDEAIILVREDMDISIEFREYHSAAAAACVLCDIYVEKEDVKKAKAYLDSASQLFHRLPAQRTVQLRFLMSSSKYFGATGDFKKAYNFLLKHKMISDSSLNEERLLSLSQVKARYELEQKESEIKFLSELNDLQSQQIRNQRLIIVTSALAIVLFVGFLWYTVRSIRNLRSKNRIIELQQLEIEEQNSELLSQGQLLQEQNQVVQMSNVVLEEKVKRRTLQLETSNTELDTFLYHASHDIRRPITTILGLSSVSRLSSGDDKTALLFDHISNTARDMDSMLSKLHMAHELNRPPSERGQINLREIIDELVRKFVPELRRLKIAYEYVGEQSAFCFSNASLLQIVFSNLIENSINFRKIFEEGNSIIRIRTAKIGDKFSITVEDNGIGIEEQYLDRIFELYFRGTAKSKGNGLGLYLVKKAATLLGATIQVASNYEEGSKFTLVMQ